MIIYEDAGTKCINRAVAKTHFLNKNSLGVIFGLTALHIITLLNRSDLSLLSYLTTSPPLPSDIIVVHLT